jgi:hypothetical protein
MSESESSRRFQPSKRLGLLTLIRTASICRMMYSTTARRNPRRRLQLRAQQTARNGGPQRYLSITGRIPIAGEDALFQMAHPFQLGYTNPRIGESAPSEETASLGRRRRLNMMAYFAFHKEVGSEGLDHNSNVQFAQYLREYQEYRQVHKWLDDWPVADHVTNIR